ncbi:MAG: hypothetical protein JXJ22_11175 [Bacteroidales bacterium]|nr:hypothetical protein [Bacteroidales bacterium]
MKTNINLLMIFVLIAFICATCEKEKENNPNLLSGQLIDYSTCKNDLKSASLLTETPDSLSCIEYSFNTESNKLTLKHINAGFNCCPESLYCNISSDGDTIVIREFEANALCHCNCLYDLDFELSGIETKDYHIKFIEPYAEEQAEIYFTIDLNTSPAGSYCVTRKQYPWGVNSTIN